ncbi:MAG: 26S proteasome complex subunit [Watsoniomyces obsoletus]|nr:MAG: 26S proteasome complex subunit [Watsoniomyces obsoletus]
MSASKETSTSSSAETNTSKPDEKPTETSGDQEKPAVALEEDDEFEDFPVEDWTQEDAENPKGNLNLWEESWDDDDINEDFSAQLKQELKKVEGK